ncbi:MAG: hypothetical protein NVV62_18125 [Terricaulis sp.]|nr:hypothetical protein [Terricaulis sp.]
MSIFIKPAEKPAAQIVSSWCLLDARTRRLRRVPAEIISRFAP